MRLRIFYWRSSLRRRLHGGMRTGIGNMFLRRRWRGLKAEHIRQTRGREDDLVSARRVITTIWMRLFESLNVRFFHGLLGRPTLTWSAHHARRMLGHYDAAHNTIVVSRVFDRADTPRCAIEYLLYHEMLHLKHPVRVKAGRRCVHSKAFQAEERLFPELEAAS